MKLNSACNPAAAREWRAWCLAIKEVYDGVLLQERRATMQVMLGMSQRARWDATLVYIMQRQCIRATGIHYHSKE